MPDVRRTAPPLKLSVTEEGGVIVASAQRMTGSLTDHLIQNREWQREAWDFYHAMGEFWYGVTWLANACSRVRLVAAKKQPGGDEPEVIKMDDVSGTDTLAVNIVEKLGGSVGGRSMILESLAVQLSVPGEGYLIGEQGTDEQGAIVSEDWSTKSTDEIRRRQTGDRRRRKSDPSRGIPPTGRSATSEPSPFEIQVEEGRWRPLADESMVCRVWWPDKQYSWRACSSALPALPILRELDLLNRRIIAELISRIAMNGILAIPTEATFPVRKEFADDADPFVSELIDMASKAIKTPGSAASAVPMPLRVPAALIEKIRHIPFTTPLDPKLFEARDRAIKRLAATMNTPQEVLLGVADVNHWTAWQIDEAGVKIHISPLVEIMCHGLTVSYLRPMLAAQGVSATELDDYVIWYDVSELTTKPDLSVAAKEAHAVGVINDSAYRREAGFSEDDAPDPTADDGLKRQVLVALAFQGNTTAIGILWPDLEEKLKPPPQPGYDPDTGRPLAPEPPPAQPGSTQTGAPNGGTPVGTNGRQPAPAGVGGGR